MTKIVWLSSISILIVMMSTTSAVAWTATPAPTKPVYSKNLNAPEIQSDTRKLEAIVDNEQVSASNPATATNAEPAPAAAPQTILVMPSAAATTTSAPAKVPTAEEEDLEDTSQAAPPVDANFDEVSNDAEGWHQWTSEPTSVFTAVIAFFTFLLALAGGWYVYNAGAIARKQLRAYVFISNTEISGVAPLTQSVAQLAIRNTGQTPAHEVIVYGNMIFDEFPLKKDLPVLVFSDPQLTKENMGPGSERYKWEYALLPLTQDQIGKMNAGTHALYVYGEIRYRDVFKRKCYTKYLYYTGGTMGVRGNILGGYPEGNEAA